jgi:hypothetical protein
MKATELRIGNLVNENGEVIKIRQETLCDFANGYVVFEPIPLTEEWLLKFGFKKPAHTWCGDVFHLTEWDKYPINWCVAMNKNNAVIIEKLKYVHQLQNLYFALTGEELKIK